MPSSLWDSVEDLPPMAYLPEVAELLSASTYPQAPPAGSISTKSRQLFGGLMTTEDSAGEEEIDTRPAKKNKNDSARGTGNRSEVPKRQRGRPKVSTRDETAAERRRTQIRLAQRAYRNRKESTINELTQKVESLQASIKSINTGFTRLQETLLASGMVHRSSAIAQQMTDLMQQLTEAMDSPHSDTDKTSEGEDSEPTNEVVGPDRNQFGMTSASGPSMALQGQTHPTSSRALVNIQSDLPGVDTIQSIFGLNVQNLTDYQNHPVSPTSYHTSSVSKSGLLALPSEQRVSTSIDRFPNKHFYTYSFQETTLARRLHRLCIEKAFQKLLSPHVDPDWLLKKFRFTFNFSSKERIANMFKNVLARGTNEPLENWRSPFVHVGGAGLHFPRYDSDGNAVYPPNLLDPIVASAQWRIPNTETIPSEDTIEAILESIGFGGDWFDSHDVEEYLKTKGIHLEPQASFFVVDTTLVDLPALGGIESTITAGSSPRSPKSGHHLHGTAFGVQDQDDAVNSRSILQANTGPVINFTDKWLDQQQTYNPNAFDVEFAGSAMEVAVRETQLLTVEVQTFLDRLADESVCLGRAPGFRKAHVDNALVLALQEAF